MRDAHSKQANHSYLPLNTDNIKFTTLWYRQVLCANSFTSLAELSLHRAGKPALNYLVAEDRERVKGGEALDVNSVFCYQPASSSCISMCFMLMYFFSAPLGSGDMTQSCAYQHQSRMAIRKCDTLYSS